MLAWSAFLLDDLHGHTLRCCCSNPPFILATSQTELQGGHSSRIRPQLALPQLQLQAELQLLARLQPEGLGSSRRLLWATKAAAAAATSAPMNVGQPAGSATCGRYSGCLSRVIPLAFAAVGGEATAEAGGEATAAAAGAGEATAAAAGEGQGASASAEEHPILWSNHNCYNHRAQHAAGLFAGANNPPHNPLRH